MMKKIRNIILIIANALLICVFLFVLVRAKKTSSKGCNAKEITVDTTDVSSANNTTDENIVSNGDNDVNTSAGVSTSDTDAEPAAMPDIKKNEEGLAGYDYYYVPYMNAEEVPEVSNWFSMDWEPYAATTFSEHNELIIPQIKTRSLTFQDLTANYYADYSPIEESEEGISTIWYSELTEYLKNRNVGDSQLEENNLLFISEVAKMQSENTILLEENKVYQFDMDLNGTNEVIELRAVPVGDEKDYSLYINGELMDTYREINMGLYLIDLGTCKVLDLYFSGIYRDWSVPSYEQLYAYYDCAPLFLGEINGNIIVAMKSGLFVTRGNCEPYQSGIINPIFGFVHMYYVNNGRLYHLSFIASGKSDGWQQANDVWLLEKDLPYDKVDGANGTMKKGSKVLICGISEEGNLYLVNEDGQHGYLFLTYMDDNRGGEIDPLVNVSGLRLSCYLAAYNDYIPENW